jgi:hypothetical protein
MLLDLAKLTGGRVISEELGFELENDFPEGVLACDLAVDELEQVYPPRTSRFFPKTVVPVRVHSETPNEPQVQCCASP